MFKTLPRICEGSKHGTQSPTELMMTSISVLHRKSQLRANQQFEGI